jgi:hypothetical protein
MEFKARLNRDIAFTIIDEQIKSGTDPAHLTGRGLAKQYGFGSPQTWVTHLKDWRQQHGMAAMTPDDVRDAEAVEGVEPPDEAAGPEPGADNRGASFGMVSRAELLQHQEMWNRLLAERDAAHVERLKVARMEGERAGRVEGGKDAQALAEAHARMLEERIRRERMEGEAVGAQRAAQEVHNRAARERRLVVLLTLALAVPAGGGVGVWLAMQWQRPGAIASQPHHASPPTEVGGAAPGAPSGVRTATESGPVQAATKTEAEPPGAPAPAPAPAAAAPGEQPSTPPQEPAAP